MTMYPKTTLTLTLALAALALPALAATKADETDKPEKKTKTERVIILGEGPDGELTVPMPPMPPMPAMIGHGGLTIDEGDGKRRIVIATRGQTGALGPDLIYGNPGRSKPLATDEVKTWLAKMLERDGNPRLRLGTVKDKDSRTIEAVIETVDGSLVQKLNIDKELGIARRAD